MRKLCVILINVIMFALFVNGWGVRAYADEVFLAVGIRSYDNEEITVKSGSTLYTCIPVTFTPVTREEVSYSISTDDGVTFGGYVPAEGGSVTLYPDDETSPSGRWQIRFKSAPHGKEEIISETYKVCFDCTEPQIELLNPEVISDWTDDTQSVSFSLEDDNGIRRVVARCGDKVLFEEHEKGDEIKKDMEVSFPVEGAGGGENTVELTCIDIAGNSTIFTFTVMIDTNSPTISIDGVGQGAVAGDECSLTIYASDEEGEPFIEYVAERDNGEEVIRTEVTNASAPLKLSFSESGRYSVRAIAVDASGKRSREVCREFAVDTSPPEIMISGITENADMRDTAKVAIDVSEDVYEGTQVDIILQKSVPGKTESIPIESYKLMANHDTRTVDISSDGEYELEVAATDRAGNRSEAVRRFRIDRTAPDIFVTGLSEGEITSERPVLRFSAGELFYDSTIMTTELKKREAGGYVPVDTTQHVMKAQRDRVDVTVSGEGQYRLTCTACDRSGNIRSVATDFTVDLTPPVISGISDLQGKFLRSFSLPARLSALVSDATGVMANAYLNDTAIDEDAVVIEEGKYMLTIIAEDEAHNASEDSAVFMIDHTSPQIVLEGFDKEGGIRRGNTVKVSLIEEEDTLDRVCFNGKQVAIERGKSALISVNEYGEYDLEVTAHDEAGNETDTIIHTSCYAAGAERILSGKNTTAKLTRPEGSDIDMKGLMIGLISVLAGTFGLTYREYLRD